MNAPLPLTSEAPVRGLADRVRSALAWRWGTQVLAQIITWASTIAVVRLLVPGDYGLYAMTQAVVTAVAFLNGQSFATSLIQADKVDERRIGQVFALLLLLNGSLAVALLILAPYAALYYGEPQVEPMLRVQALIETAAGLANVQEIAAASERLDALILGYADLAASLGRSAAGAPTCQRISMRTRPSAPLTGSHDIIGCCCVRPGTA